MKIIVTLYVCSFTGFYVNGIAFEFIVIYNFFYVCFPLFMAQPFGKDAHAHTHAHTHTNTHTHVYIYIYIYHTQACAYTHTHTHA